MKKYLWLGLLVFGLYYINETKGFEPALARYKRYLVFPEGSSFTFAFCQTTWIYAPGNIFTEGMNWAITYDLPSNVTLIAQFKRVFNPKYTMQRRRRRDLYHKVETVVNSLGFDGRACIYRALCETEQRLAPREDNIVKHLLKIIFRFPMEKIQSSEPEEHRLYHWARRMGQENSDCVELFPACPFSLIDVALGHFISPEENPDI